MGGLFVNYFNEFRRTWQVYIEAEAPYRANTQDLGAVLCAKQLRVRMYRFPRSRTSRPVMTPEFTLRYNEYRSAAIIGSAAAVHQL